MADRAAFERFRADFPGAAAGPYLNVADCGIISRHVRQTLDTYLDGCMKAADRDAASAWVNLARRCFAQLVRASETDIAFVKNVSDGINAVATALDWRPGDNVVLCDRLEHPSNQYPWYNLRERLGVEVRIAEGVNGHIDAEQLVARIDGRTRIVSVSMVTFAPGFRTDLETLGRECRARGALLLVDAAQAVGVLDIDLSRLPVDALAVGTPKALLGLYGMGFLFVRDALASALRPMALSRSGVGDAIGPGGVVLRPGAGRFDVGNYNYAGCVAAAASMQQLLAIGTAQIERHVLALSAALDAGLRAQGLPVFDAGPEARRSHIVSVGTTLEDHIDATSDEGLNDLHQYLAAQGIQASIRRGILRFSMHAYNNRDDVERTLHAVQCWRAKRGTPRHERRDVGV